MNLQDFENLEFIAFTKLEREKLKIVNYKKPVYKDKIKTMLEMQDGFTSISFNFIENILKDLQYTVEFVKINDKYYIYH